MSQVHQPATARPVAAGEAPSAARAVTAASARATPPVQARQQFDAALQRAQDFDDEPRRAEPRQEATVPTGAPLPRRADAETESRESFEPLGPLHPFASQHTGALPAVAGAEALLGAAPTQLPMQPSMAGLSAESLPGQAIGGTRQYSLALPGDASAAALTLRMTQAGATHWQLRLGADATTRQQLGPHVERLRDRLRQRQGQHTADFDLEDSGG
jgi:hypothetical protein